jgi:ribonucleoside-diphosphate reductase alpha chain
MILPPITAHRSPGTSSASNIGKASIEVKKEQRGVMATAATATGANTFTAEEKNACSIDAMLNGGTCEACQ